MPNEIFSNNSAPALSTTLPTLPAQGAYGLADPVQNISRCSNACTKAGNFNADLDGNGKTDMVWYNNRTGEVQAWMMNGGSCVAQTIGTMDIKSGWALQGYGDFNGDGKSDILWQNSNTGEVRAWMMNGASVTSSITLGGSVPGSGWTLAGMGDFDGAGKTDLFWYNRQTGETSAWLMNGGNNLPTYASYSNVDPQSGWTVAGMGDFCGDGKTDVLWYNQKTGDVGAWMMNGAAVNAYVMYGSVDPNSGWAIKGMGDLTGTGKTDLFWQNTQTGETQAWMMGATGCSAKVSYGTLSPQAGWTFEGLADVSGNGKADAVWYNRVTMQTETWLMNGTATPDCYKQQVSSPDNSFYDLQAMGDFNGTGKAEMFWRNYGMYSDKTQIWCMDGTSGYTVNDTLKQSTNSGYQLVSINQMTGLNMG
jgi:hypothetical protein